MQQRKLRAYVKLKRTSISMVASGKNYASKAIDQDNRWYFDYNKLV